jgi:hypothetical protein
LNPPLARGRQSLVGFFDGMIPRGIALGDPGKFLWHPHPLTAGKSAAYR